MPRIDLNFIPFDSFVCFVVFEIYFTFFNPDECDCLKFYFIFRKKDANSNNRKLNFSLIDFNKAHLFILKF